MRADLLILLAAFAAGTLLAELAGARNTGVAMAFGQLAFGLALVVVLVRRPQIGPARAAARQPAGRGAQAADPAPPAPSGSPDPAPPAPAARRPRTSPPPPPPKKRGSRRRGR